jgi:hypothetical protein
MLARLTVTTDLTGLRAECLSAPARGMAGDAVGAGVVGATDAAVGATAVAFTADAGSPVDAASLADVDLHVVRLAVSTVVAGSAAALWPTAVAGASTVVAAVGSTVVVDMGVADTANRGESGAFLIR